jgi:hypothetical protein
MANPYDLSSRPSKEQRARLGGEARIAALEARLAAAEAAQREAEAWRDKLLAWQDAVTSEVLMHPELPCGRDEVSVEDVPGLLAVLAGRIEHPDDYEGPPHVPDENEAAFAPATPASEAGDAPGTGGDEGVR